MQTQKSLIALIPVASVGVTAIGYLPTHHILLVQFDVGFTMVYEGVPAHVYRELMSAHDKRRYIRKYLDGRYRKHQKTAI